jgi:hypothetical protein
VRGVLSAGKPRRTRFQEPATDYCHPYRDKAASCSWPREHHSVSINEEVKTKLTPAWRAAATRLIEVGYAPCDVYATMTSVALSGAGGQANDNPPSAAKAIPRTKRPTVPFREG